MGVDPSLVKVVLEQGLQLLVQLRELRARVQLLAARRRVCNLSLGNVGAGQVGDGLDAELAAVGDEVDAEGALVRAGDEDVDVGREGGLGVVLSANVSRMILSCQVSCQGESHLLVSHLLPVTRRHIVLRRNLEVSS